MDTNTQISKLSDRLGEPSDPTQGRWTATQLLSFLNDGRRRVCEETRCFQVVDEQSTVAGTNVYSVTNDFIFLEELTYNGLPLRIVRPADWNDVVGMDETTAGAPFAYMYFSRQIQVYPVPTEIQPLQYRGYAYASDLVAGNPDPDLTDAAADACIWEAAVIAKGSDERNVEFETRQAERGKAELKKQYMPRGPRYIRTGLVARRFIA